MAAGGRLDAYSLELGGLVRANVKRKAGRDVWEVEIKLGPQGGHPFKDAAFKEAGARISAARVAPILRMPWTDLFTPASRTSLPKRSLVSGFPLSLQMNPGCHADPPLPQGDISGPNPILGDEHLPDRACEQRL